MLSNIFNMDTTTELLMAKVIELSRFTSKGRWQKGKKLKILLVGYNGARNTGADVRVEAMVRQFYYVFGKENIHIGVMTLNESLTEAYFKPPTEMIHLSSVFFRDLLKYCSEYHIAVLSEGSCFKSKFANALTTFFFGAAGIMKRQGKPCIAYGSEAGAMDNILQWFVKHYCDKAYIISRTEPSKKVVEKLGLEGDIGTDTAWTFPPGDREWAIDILKKQGWDGQKPIIGIAVVNPFYFPVKPNLTKFIKMKLKREKREDNYDKWYFFSTSEERTKQFNKYISDIAKAVNLFVDKHNFFPVVIGMDKMDYASCEELRKQLKIKAPLFWSGDYDGYQMTSILWQLSMLITSRYHARVLSMPAGVPSIGISIDERLENLMSESGHINDYFLWAWDEKLDEKLIVMLEKLWENKEKVRKEIFTTIPSYLQKMANMGKIFKKFVAQNFPEFPLLPDSDHWLDYLPPLYPELKKVVEEYGK